MARSAQVHSQVGPMSVPLAGTPVFIGGRPRSGTSLLVSLLDGHPDLVVLPEETKFLKRVSRQPFVSVDQAVDYLFDRTNLIYLNPARRISPPEEVGVGVSDYSGLSYEELRQATAAHFATSDLSVPRLLESIVRAYTETLGGGGAEARRYFIEKTPDNEFRMGAAWRWWPQARLVYVVRDPRDTFLSHASKTALRSGRRTQNLRVETFVLGYARSLGSALRHASAHPGLCTIIRYEALVERPDAEMRRLCSFLGLDYHPLLETPTKLGRPWVGVGSRGRPTEGGVRKTHVGGWEDRLPERDVEYIETYLGKAMMLLGYPLSVGLKPGLEFLRTLRGPTSHRMQTLRALASLYKPVGIVWHSKRRRGSR